MKSSFAGSKSLPGTSPIFAIRATIAASCAVGGLVFISCARRPKYASTSRSLTNLRTPVFMSKAGSTTPAGGVYGFPNALSGTTVNWSCRACTAL
jgi:hypothetical protein